MVGALLMIRLKFKCQCQPEEQFFEVRDRLDSEDVVEWVEDAVRPALGIAHRAVSPTCMAPSVEYLGIPMPENADAIGTPPKLDS
jgi:hypothetical protein